MNEEDNIERCVRSLIGVADEIVILDSLSTDRTAEICSKLPVIFHQKAWMGYAQSKNYLNSLTTNEYILSIDADEVLSDELRESILREKEQGFHGAYSVNRLTNYLGQWIYHSGWYPDIKVRLFPKSICQWDGMYVHETLEMKQPLEVNMLNGHLEHYSYKSFEDHRARADKYSILTAQKMAAQGKKASALKPYLSAFGRFVAMYIIKGGFLDGKMGYKIAQISAQSNILKYKELRRINSENN